MTWITYLTLTCPKSLIFPKSLFLGFSKHPSSANVLFINFLYNRIHRWRHSKHDVTTLHETFSAKLLSHDVISLEYETRHTNLTLVNERQNNVTSCTNCPYLITTFIPLDVDKFGSVCFFYCFSTFCQLNVFFFKYALPVWNLTKEFFFQYRKYFIRQRWLPVT